MTEPKPTVLAITTDLYCDPETGVCAIPSAAQEPLDDAKDDAAQDAAED